MAAGPKIWPSPDPTQRSGWGLGTRLNSLLRAKWTWMECTVLPDITGDAMYTGSDLADLSVSGKVSKGGYYSLNWTDGLD